LTDNVISKQKLLNNANQYNYHKQINSTYIM